MKIDYSAAVEAYDYELPERLVAQVPPRRRDGGRLWVTAATRHYAFAELTRFVRAGDLLVLNDSRVLPGRLFGVKASGGRVEILLERLLNVHRALVQLRMSRPMRPGAVIRTDVGDFAVGERHGFFYELTAVGRHGRRVDIQRRFVRGGGVPLPPYIKRDNAAAVNDRRRYQTVFARDYGSVAAPTAGLHFTRAMLAALQNKGVRLTYLTLHIGAGTFTPIRGNIAQHKMHSECYAVSRANAAAVTAAKKRGGRIIAIGTTALRALESAAIAGGGQVVAAVGETDLFIKPGFKFCAADMLLTNFHLPRSSLLVLVCAFGGYERMMAAYHRAVTQKLRFYSYGDCMLIDRQECRAE